MTGGNVEQARESEIHSPWLQLAELRSEGVRVKVLLGVCASFLVVILIRGAFSLAQGNRGEAWPFAVLLAAFSACEVFWLRFIVRTIVFGRVISPGLWVANLLGESLLPTIAILLQMHVSAVGPHRALSSPVVLAYFFFIMLSALHLSPRMSHLAGVVSAAGYSTASIYAFVHYPAGAEKLVLYGTSVSCAVLLLAGGFVAGAMARQIRLYVIAASDEAEMRAKVTQLKHDLEIARSIQQGLLPKAPPQIKGFDIEGWNQPADETGGDYFDWQVMPDGRLAVTVADVTGHGIGSALGMTICRAYARAALTTDADLRCFLDRLSRLLHEDLPAGKFVTLAAGLLDAAGARLHLISAGHGPLLLYSAADDTFHVYEAQGPPLGLLPQLSYRGPHLLHFAPGDILILVTDGFVEWANVHDEEFGVARIEEVIRTCCHLPAKAIIAELQSRIAAFAGAMPQLDDLTALVIKREEGAAW